MIKRQKKSKVLNCINPFLRDETGAITVEWVVLTAGVIALSIGAYSAFSFELDDSTTNELDFMAMTLMQKDIRNVTFCKRTFFIIKEKWLI